MKTSRTFILSILMLGTMLLQGCDTDSNDEVGNWKQMEWTSPAYQTTQISNNTYTVVPAEGGTFVYHCTNYSGFWLDRIVQSNSIMSDHTDNWQTQIYPDQDSDRRHISSDCCDVTAQGDSLTVVISPSTEFRVFHVDVTAGDIFHLFRFIQNYQQ